MRDTGVEAALSIRSHHAAPQSGNDSSWGTQGQARRRGPQRGRRAGRGEPGGPCCARPQHRRDRPARPDRAGALKDMVQNHLMEAMALVLMEQPARLDADSVRGVRVEGLRAVATPVAERLRPESGSHRALCAAVHHAQRPGTNRRDTATRSALDTATVHRLRSSDPRNAQQRPDAVHPRRRSRRSMAHHGPCHEGMVSQKSPCRSTRLARRHRARSADAEDRVPAAGGSAC